MGISNFVKRSTIAFVGALSVISFAGAAPSYAGIVNGDFESGNLNGWGTIGSASIENGGVSLSASGVSDTELETFLGLSVGTLDALNNINATNGSAIKQTITANAGDTLSFDWLFQANDYAPYNDFSFFTIGSIGSKLADVFQVGNYGQTASKTSYTFDKAGTYTVGFGVVNALDTAASPTLAVDNVKLSSVAAVPEPASMLGILAVGAFGVTSLQKRKQQAKA
ncbi:PEP-CTERM sorting domain-containing protein [Iningainema tapete]|uniref:PEP-CTERM sorting domain-containing protein n=1 Tax=Iningainema tapete BLCC-T55 TaxID=2748662 RepID=A0A8J6XQ56_9CYAN|nr:PEP-CTERM sorting domain-containing protein [Iningainema tapete]MBD2775326.1 PEP-CTERM sorting domain-containing protein [Iningainema tapete BLCC-T55]